MAQPPLRSRRRLSLFSLEGAYLGTLPTEAIPRTQFVGTPWGASAEGVLMLGAIGTVFITDGPQSMSLGLRWVPLDGARVDTLARADIRQFGTSEMTDMRYILNVPFGVTPSAAGGRSGFVFTLGLDPAIHQYDGAGRPVRIARLDEPLRPVTAADREEAVRAEIARFPDFAAERVRRVFEQMEPEAHWPSFEALLMDDLGWVWARLWGFPGGPATTWMVFDDEGVARGTVELPQGLEIHQIGADFVLGHWRDALGVEYVRRYRLARSTEHSVRPLPERSAHALVGMSVLWSDGRDAGLREPPPPRRRSPASR